MDNYGANNNDEFNRVISELTQGRDLVQQLQLHLNVPFNSSSSPENTREFLLHNIQSKFDRALSLLQHNSTGDNSSSLLPYSNSSVIPNFGISDSPRSSPPHSEDSDRDLESKDPHATRKRKSNTPRWTKQVQIHPGAPREGTLDDGFSWRKYGQKDILGAKHPSISKDDFNFNTHHDHPNNGPYIPSFNNFPSSSSSHVNTDHQDYSFLPNSSTIPSNNFVENFPPSFNNMSAGTSQINNFGGEQNDADYQFNSMGFESNFPYDYHGFSS
ncbi:unnamed protein product [Withania somnifera]